MTVDALADHLGRPLWLIAESDRNDPRWSCAAGRRADTGSTPRGATTSITPCTAVLTGERTGYYEDFGSLAQVARALRRVYRLRPGLLAVPQTATTAARLETCPGPGFSGTCRTMTRSATGRSGSGSAALMIAGRAPSGGRVGAVAPRSCPCCSGRGMGRVHAVPVLHRPP